MALDSGTPAGTGDHAFQARSTPPAGVAELVDALDLGSSDESCGGSNPSARTTISDLGISVPARVQAGRSKHWIKVKNRKHPAMGRVIEAL